MPHPIRCLYDRFHDHPRYCASSHASLEDLSLAALLELHSRLARLRNASVLASLTAFWTVTGFGSSLCVLEVLA